MVQDAAGRRNPVSPGHGIGAGDLNGDGDLDLACTGKSGLFLPENHTNPQR